MMKKPDFDLDAAHEFFSAKCFNQAWDLLDKSERSAEEDEQMIQVTLASHWHWTQREDCSPTTISIAYWQTSRVYAAVGQAKNARRHAQRCLAASQRDDVAPFYLGYAYEALARAELVAANLETMEQYLREARRVADTIPDPEARRRLVDDLETIR